MPIYEYRCSSCGHELETLQKLSDAPLVACPSCNADALVKHVSAAGFHLKGSGWYATDFRGSGKPAEKKADGESKSANEPKAGSEGADKSGDKTATTDKSGDKTVAADKSGGKTAAADKSGDKAATPATASGSGASPASS